MIFYNKSANNIIVIVSLFIFLAHIGFRVTADSTKNNFQKYLFVKVINNEINYPITAMSKNEFSIVGVNNKKTKKIIIKPKKTKILFFNNDKKEKSSGNILKITANNYSAKIYFPFLKSHVHSDNIEELQYNNIKWNFINKNITPQQIKTLNNINNSFILTKNLLFLKTQNNFSIKHFLTNKPNMERKNSSQNISFFVDNPCRNFVNLISIAFPSVKNFFNIANQLIASSRFSILTPIIVKNIDTSVSLDFSISEGSKNKNIKSLNSIVFLEYKIKYLSNNKTKYKKIEAGTIKGFGKLAIKNIPLPGNYKKAAISNLKIILEITGKNNYFNRHCFNIDNISLLGCIYPKNNPYGIEGAINKYVYQMKVNYKPTSIELTGSKL